MTHPWNDPQTPGGQPPERPNPEWAWPSAAPSPGAPGPTGPAGPPPAWADPRYAAYGSPVARAPVARPGPLRAAVILMWIGAGITFLNLVGTFLFLDQIRETVEDQLEADGTSVSESTLDASVNIGIAVATIAGLIGIAMWVTLAVMNNKGKNWARVTATVIGGIGILFALGGLAGAGMGRTALSVASNGITIVLAASILILLWNSRNKAFYDANS